MEESPSRIPFFFGAFKLTIDSKNRLLIPAEVRKTFDPERDGNGFFVTMNEMVPWFYPENYYKSLLRSQIYPNMAPTEDLLKYTELKLSLAQKIEWDSQGRVVIPDEVLVDAELKETTEVTLIGMNDHLELRDRAKWEIRRQELIRDSRKIENWARENLTQATPPAPPAAKK